MHHSLVSGDGWSGYTLLTQWKRSDGECVWYDVSFGTGAASVPSVHWLITLLLVKTILSVREVMAQQRMALGWNWASSDGKLSSGGIWGDEIWRVLAVLFSFFNSQNLESFLKNYIFLLKFSKEFLLTRLVWPHACRAVNCHICNRWLWLMSYPNSYVNICFLHHTQPLQLKLMIYNIIFWHLPAKIPFSIHIHVSKCWRLLLSKHYHQSLVRDSTSVSVYHLDIWTLPDVNFRAREQI